MTYTFEALNPLKSLRGLVLIFLILSCTKSKRIIPESTGNNSKELLRVIDHFKKKDSLKYVAARFLINNMGLHYANSKTINPIPVHQAVFNEVDHQAKYNYKHELTQTKPTTNINFLKFATKTVIPKILDKAPELSVSYDTIYDVETITKNQLITHTDNAFYVWKNSRFCKNMSFQEFKHTILPYRYLDGEQLKLSTTFNRTLLHKFITVDSLNTLNKVIERFNFYVSKVRFLTGLVDFKDDLGFYNVLKWEKLSCETQANWTANILNDCGIPTEIHQTPNWLNRDGGHTWCASRDENGVYHPFSPQWQNLGDSLFYKRASKVYKKTYEEQKDTPYFIKDNKETVPKYLDTPFLKDVSDQYHNTVTLNIPIDAMPQNKNLAYLSIFASQHWKPVAWGNINKKTKTVQFDKVPVNATYIFGFFNNDVFSPVGNPFYVSKHGNRHYFNPNNNSKTTILVNEKYPQKEHLKKWLELLKGAKFTGANKPDFSDEETLYELKETPLPIVYDINITSKSRYKYARFKTQNNAVSYLSIFECFTRKAPTDSISLGTRPYITKPSDKVLAHEIKTYSKIEDIPKKWSTNNTRDNCLDGNIETFTNNFRIGLNFETPKRIDKIRFAFRNANNYVNYRDTYKLSYYDNGWKTHRVKKSKYNYLTFENLPSNTIYWLSNLTKGKEELPFIYHNSKQLFLNHDNISTYFED
ncbi:hypothetical protein [Algibacter sp. 2305UL17-15]|uniref:hypothetical protein n=1 Tax=Algibacter sp. 2305UL17-15 TaxID=3231268 RepID=UPI00345B4B0B